MSSLFLREFDRAPAVGETVTLEGAEAKHAVTVNRIRVGEELLLGDGHGLVAACVVEEVSPRELRARVLGVETRAPQSPELWLVQALAKGDRDEMAVQAATELGVSGVIPWAAERSISRWQAEKREKGRLRWETIAREAAKQSIRAFLPEVRELSDLAGLCALAGDCELLVLDPTAPLALTAHLAGRAAPAEGEPELNTSAPAARPIALVVGPEGGLSERELARLEEAGAVRVVLGETILRTSTAGPAALAVINAALGRW